MIETAVFIFLGFAAQLIDGALGMAYGVFLTTALSFWGVPVSHASAAVHFSEMFTTLASGISHFKMKNVDWGLLKKLAPAGAAGGIIGAAFLSVAKTETVKPFVCLYLLILGIWIVRKSFARIKTKKNVRHIAPLGFVGGFLDAMGGGGWGPIVTGTLIARGNNPRQTIGTTNLSEFFVTATQSAIFFVSIGLGYWKIVGGLVVGGCLAAPLAAFVCAKINPKILMLFVGILIIITNAAAIGRLAF